MLAYWHLTHATEQIATGGGEGREMSNADLRRTLARPASLGDILEAWMMTHPRKKEDKHSVASKAALGRDMLKDGSTEAGLDFWFGGN